MKNQVLRHEEFTRTLYIHLGSVDLCTIPVPCEQGKDTCVPPVSRQWRREPIPTTPRMLGVWLKGHHCVSGPSNCLLFHEMVSLALNLNPGVA